MPRITHKRAAELLSKVEEDIAAEIGTMFPQTRNHTEEMRRYINRMNELGFSKSEAMELFRYSKQ